MLESINLGAKGYCFGFTASILPRLIRITENKQFLEWRKQEIKQQQYTMYRGYIKAYFPNNREFNCPLLGDIPYIPVDVNGNVYDKKTLEARLDEIEKLKTALNKMPQIEIAKRTELSDKIAKCKENAMQGYCLKKELKFSKEFAEKVKNKVIQFIEEQKPHLYSDPESDSFTVLEDGTAVPSKSLRNPPKSVDNSSSLSLSSRITSYISPYIPSYFQPAIKPPSLFSKKKNVKFSAEEVALHFWLNPKTSISDQIVQKVNHAAYYLKMEGFELTGIEADGNSFCNAFLKGYQSLSRKSSLLDHQENKISHMRKMIAAQFKTIQNGETPLDRIEEIQEDAAWLTADEGSLLARAYSIPIRLVKVIQDQNNLRITDMLVFPEKVQFEQEWKTLDDSEKPEEYIFIVDLGDHFLCANLSANEEEILEQTSQDLAIRDNSENTFVNKYYTKEYLIPASKIIISASTITIVSLGIAYSLRSSGRKINQEDRERFSLIYPTLIAPERTRSMEKVMDLLKDCLTWFTKVAVTPR